MILLADIGNSSIKIALADKKKLKKIYRMEDIKGKSVSFFEKSLRAYFKKKNIKSSDIDVACFCSVVPSLNNTFKKAVRQVAGCKVLVAGKDIPIAIKNKYKKPKEVGTDRLIDAVAAYNMFPGKNSIVVDFGTAITFDVITSKGEYLGGLILPGLQSSLKALAASAELLPSVKITSPKGFIGKDTRTSIENGLIYATHYACEGIIEKLKKKYGKDTGMVATGGYAKLFKKLSKSINKVDNELTLHGLRLNLEKNGVKL